MPIYYPARNIGDIIYGRAGRSSRLPSVFCGFFSRDQGAGLKAGKEEQA